MNAIGTKFFLQKKLNICLILFVILLLILITACGAPEREINETPLVEQNEKQSVIDNVPTSENRHDPSTVESEPSSIDDDFPSTIENELPIEATSDSSQTSNEKLFIWQIEAAKSVAFLMGSIHLGKEDIYPLDSSIEEAFEMADNLVVEVDISDVNPITTTQLLTEYGAYPGGESLKDSLSDELYSRVSELFGNMGISMLMIDRYKPWVISMLIEELQMQELGCSAQYGIDIYFIERAKEATKTIIELETVEYQLDLLSSFSDELMITLLEDLLERPLTQEDMDVLFDAWNNGDTAAMKSLIFEEIDVYPELEPYFDTFYTERNYTMADKIEGFLTEDEVYFIVVGAAHLVGDEGIISILEGKGYEIIQLLRRGD